MRTQNSEARQYRTNTLGESRDGRRSTRDNETLSRSGGAGGKLSPGHKICTNISDRSFLKRPGAPNVPIQAIGLSLYEQLPFTSNTSSSADPSKSSKQLEDNVDPDVEQPGTKVTRTQWLDLSSLEMANLIGKNVLIVDEVDDTRTTLEYAVRELEKDVEEARKAKGMTGDEGKTKFSIFVLHNKDKEKRGHLPEDMLNENRYLAAVTLPDYWICYPWEAQYVVFVKKCRSNADV